MEIIIHRMMTGVDNEPIVARSKVDITENDTAETLYNKVTSAGGELFKETLPTFADNTFTLTPQNESEATYHLRGEPYGGQINPHWSDNTKITKRSLG